MILFSSCSAETYDIDYIEIPIESFDKSIFHTPNDDQQELYEYLKETNTTTIDKKQLYKDIIKFIKISIHNISDTFKEKLSEEEFEELYKKYQDLQIDSFMKAIIEQYVSSLDQINLHFPIYDRKHNNYNLFTKHILETYKLDIEKTWNLPRHTHYFDITNNPTSDHNKQHKQFESITAQIKEHISSETLDLKDIMKFFQENQHDDMKNKIQNILNDFWCSYELLSIYKKLYKTGPLKMKFDAKFMKTIIDLQIRINLSLINNNIYIIDNVNMYNSKQHNCLSTYDTIKSQMTSFLNTKFYKSINTKFYNQLIPNIMNENTIKYIITLNYIMYNIDKEEEYIDKAIKEEYNYIMEKITGHTLETKPAISTQTNNPVKKEFDHNILNNDEHAERCPKNPNEYDIMDYIMDNATIDAIAEDTKQAMTCIDGHNSSCDLIKYNLWFLRYMITIFHIYNNIKLYKNKQESIDKRTFLKEIIINTGIEILLQKNKNNNYSTVNKQHKKYYEELQKINPDILSKINKFFISTSAEAKLKTEQDLADILLEHEKIYNKYKTNHNKYINQYEKYISLLSKNHNDGIQLTNKKLMIIIKDLYNNLRFENK